MKRIGSALVMGAIVASVIGVSGVRADHQCINAEVNFQYCGEHPRLSALPLRFRMNLSSRPANLTQSEALAAANGAINAWNAAWPIPSGDPLCPALCLSSSPTSTVGPSRNGANEISWAPSFGSCAAHGHDGVAVACIWFEGDAGAARHRIAEVDIVLNSTRSWYQPQAVDGSNPSRSAPVQVLAGEATIVEPQLGDNNLYDLIGGGKGKYDVQSAITHELGHALGLEDIGDANTPYPGSLLDAGRYQQTMYRWYYRGTTYKRTLGEGDLAGVAVAAAATLVDGG